MTSPHKIFLLEQFLSLVFGARNKKAYQNAPLFPSSIFKEALRHATEFFYLGPATMKQSQIRAPIFIKWTAPEEGWLKLNSDGAFDPISNCMAAGGSIRNHVGNWVTGFQQFLGIGNSLLAKCWGIVLGIRLAIVNLWIESDCDILINLLNAHALNPAHHLAPMVSYCSSSLRDFNSYKITHVLSTGRLPSWTSSSISL